MDNLFNDTPFRVVFLQKARINKWNIARALIISVKVNLLERMNTVIVMALIYIEPHAYVLDICAIVVMFYDKL